MIEIQDVKERCEDWMFMAEELATGTADNGHKVIEFISGQHRVCIAMPQELAMSLAQMIILDSQQKTSMPV